MTDQYFTPNWAARLVAEVLPSDFAGIIVDPAAGSGSLLRAVVSSGRDVEVIALDADRTVIDSLKKEFPDWTVGRCDTLTPRARAGSPAWRSMSRTGVDWVLLNPPFSYRGGPSNYVSLGEFSGRVSPPLAFVAMVLSDISPRAGVVAILPDGSLFGAKYQDFWAEIRSGYDVDVVADLSNTAFRGARAQCRVVRIGVKAGCAKSIAAELMPPAIRFEGCRCVEVIRGRVPRHMGMAIGPAEIPYLHTTDLVAGEVQVTSAFGPSSHATSAPFVLVPRVGRPQGKIAALLDGEVVLSDCLIALRPVSEDPQVLVRAITSDLAAFAALYVGTGAPYVTIDRLVKYLRERGINALVRGACSGPPVCQCNVSRAAVSHPTLGVAADVA